MTHSNKSTNPLRQRMIDDMTLRKLAPKTQAGYLRAVMKFTRFFGRSPDLASDAARAMAGPPRSEPSGRVSRVLHPR